MQGYLMAEPEREVGSLSSSFRLFPLDFMVFSILVKCTQNKKIISGVGLSKTVTLNLFGAVPPFCTRTALKTG